MIIKTDPLEIFNLSNMNFKISAINMFKKLYNKMENLPQTGNYFKIQRRILELKNTISAIKKSTDGFNRLEIPIKVIITNQKAGQKKMEKQKA